MSACVSKSIPTDKSGRYATAKYSGTSLKWSLMDRNRRDGYFKDVYNACMVELCH
jgi:hypothetical protein